ncbi:hypothetical protein V496_08489 [Pseudogymnoascus sp. VKM F-4515 (FW-2607)]|nr:hypothetical protein V496_08489 [Pseudogymnoascus sp. VKM F-4515 (FW-2607)]
MAASSPCVVELSNRQIAGVITVHTETYTCSYCTGRFKGPKKVPRAPGVISCGRKEALDKCTRAPTFDFLVVVVQPNALNTPNTYFH